MINFTNRTVRGEKKRSVVQSLTIKIIRNNLNLNLMLNNIPSIIDGCTMQITE
jgi:hypothetical protein